MLSQRYKVVYQYRCSIVNLQYKLYNTTGVVQLVICQFFAGTSHFYDPN